MADILAATGATRSRAYEVAGELRGLLATLARPRGRPPAEPTPASPSQLAEVRKEALRFVMACPGCVRSEGARMAYTEPWRGFVIDLAERYPEVSRPELAAALNMPLGTLEDWLGRSVEPASAEAPSLDAKEGKGQDGPRYDAKRAQVETVLDAWRNWHGDFSAFCRHVERDLRIEFGKTAISNILFTHGERKPKQRPGRSRDEHALRGAFDTFFAGAQWVADGKRVEVVIDGETHHVNLELVTDAATSAAVGIDVRNEEDSDALIAAFKGGIETTQEPPIAMLVDNRPSNHTPEVDAVLGDTMRIDATLYRPQNKAHVEGSFGLFAQKAPPIVLDTSSPRALACAVALLVATTFYRVLNGAPRRDRDGRTRIELYAQGVTDEERQAALASLQERLRKQQLARQTRAARVDPTMRAYLDQAFERIALLDPERRLRDVIAGYPRDAIVDGIAIFEAKQQRGTLPDGADGRYLLGIVRNLHHQHESDAITEALLHERILALDHFLAPMVRLRDKILTGPEPDVLSALTHQLIDTDRELDRHFWLDALAQAAPVEQSRRRDFAQRCARRIHARFSLGNRERHRLVRMLLRRLFPIE